MISEWPFLMPRVQAHGTTGPKAEKKNVLSVLCFNKRTVIFISYKRIEIKVFLLRLHRSAPSCWMLNSARDFFSLLESVCRRCSSSSSTVLFSNHEEESPEKQLKTLTKVIHKKWRESLECKKRWRYKHNKSTTILHTIAFETVWSVVRESPILFLSQMKWMSMRKRRNYTSSDFDGTHGPSIALSRNDFYLFFSIFL